MTVAEHSSSQPLALIVDDDKLVRTLVRDSLERFGFEVLEAKDGYSALEMTLSIEPELILLDLLMPGLDGFDTCRELRNLPHGKYVPILVLTSLEDEESINRAYDAGGTDFITKPINMTALGHHARYLLRSSRTFKNLQVNEARLSSAQRIARLGDWEWTPKTNSVVCSEELARLLAMPDPTEDMDYFGFLQFIHPSDRDRVRDDLEHVAKTGQEYDRDLLVVRADGQTRYMHTHAEVTRDESGRESKVKGIFHDITERKLLEQDLDKERDFVSAILDTAGALVVVMDNEGRIIRFNRACEELTGYAFKEVRGKTLLDYFIPDDEKEAVLGVFNSLLKTRTLYEYENHWQTADGRRRMIAWSNTVLENEGRVEYIIATGIDITERKRAEEQIVRLGYYDSLTNLPNRYLFKDRLVQANNHAQRHGKMVGVLFLDLDRFKRVNETFGHSVGDQLLRLVAQRLRDCVRSSDTVARADAEKAPFTLARFGGDEFSVLMTEMEKVQDVANVARRVVDCLSTPLVLENGQELFVTVSIGISLNPADGDESESLIKNAEVAMYHAKNQGRGNFQFYNASMNAMAFQRILLENDLQRAFERDEFVLFYQPLVDIATQRIVAAEALVRWNHPQQGLIFPAHFLSLANETGLIDKLVTWTLRESCTQNVTWQHAGYRPIRMAVNVCSQQFIQEDLKGLITDVLRQTGCPPENLELEITEETVMEEEEMSIAILKGIREMGITISIDDFGTGYSSLSYLKSFPIDTLKIDMSFLRGIPEDPENVSIVKAIIALGQSLGLKVLAEGVERPEQVEFLREAGCDLMQGYYFSQAVPADEFTKMLDKSE